MFLLAGGFSLRQARAEDKTRPGAANYQAIQEAKKKGGARKKPTAVKTKNLDSSYVVYEVKLEGNLKFVKII